MAMLFQISEPEKDGGQQLEMEDKEVVELIVVITSFVSFYCCC